MRNFLLTNLPLLLWVITAIEVVFAVILYRAWSKHKHPMLMCILLIDLGLFLDAFFIALGGVVPNGLPEMLSRTRFIAHGALIPGNFDLIFFISMFGEVFLILFFYLYAKVFIQKEA